MTNKPRSYRISPEEQTKPCRRGHRAGRTETGACLQCLRDFSKARYAKPERLDPPVKPPKPVRQADPLDAGPFTTGPSAVEVIESLLDYLRQVPGPSPTLGPFIRSLEQLRKFYGNHFSTNLPLSFEDQEGEGQTHSPPKDFDGSFQEDRRSTYESAPTGGVP